MSEKDSFVLNPQKVLNEHYQMVLESDDITLLSTATSNKNPKVFPPQAQGFQNTPNTFHILKK